jgi:endonuclease/exonuclease/phosphatase family metal-dependent hydrolase
MKARRLIRVVSCNFERNGGGNREKWLAMHQRLAALRPTILCRQENPGHAQSGAGRKLFNDSKRILSLSGDLGPKLGSTALYYDPEVFEQITVWETAEWPAWLLHPVAMTLRLRDTKDVDFVAACTHLSYNSPALRAAQADDVTRFADRVETYETSTGTIARKLPVLAIGQDCNSYVDPDRLVPGEAPIPELTQIRDPQHRAHRSYEIAPGQRVMDSQPNRILLTAELEDVARHAALTPGGGGLAAVAPTVAASNTHGPAHRVDLIFTSRMLLPALVSVEVIEMKGLSDHDTVLATYDHDHLVELYRQHFPSAA